MKPFLKYFPLISCLYGLLLCSCYSTKGQSTEKSLITTDAPKTSVDTVIAFAKIEFDSMAYDFGTIRQGEVLEKTIYFTNTGKADLKIDLITACECTTLDWSRLPIKEGQRSNIKIRYNSKDKVGPQTVDLDIMANTATGFSYTKFKLIVIL
jgi:hypothetical protein